MHNSRKEKFWPESMEGELDQRINAYLNENSEEYNELRQQVIQLENQYPVLVRMRDAVQRMPLQYQISQ